MDIYCGINGLYPEERDYILRKLRLLNHCVDNILYVDYSVLKSSHNHITVKGKFKDDEKFLLVVRGLMSIEVPDIPTEYDDYIPLSQRETPSISLTMKKDFDKFNKNKGMEYVESMWSGKGSLK